MLDGTPGENRSLPSVYVEAVGIDPSDTVTDSSGKHRTRVNVRVESRCQETAAAFVPALPFKEETKRLDMCTFESGVHVRNPDIFVKGAAWKVRKTRE